MTPQHKKFFHCIAFITALVTAGAVYELRDAIVAEWYILRLGSRDADERLKAIDKLGELRSSRAVRPLIEMWRRQKRPEALFCAESLTKIGPPAARPLLRLAAEPQRYEPRIYAIVGNMGPALLPTLKRALDDPNKRVQKATVLALGRIGSSTETVLPEVLRVILSRPQARLGEVLISLDPVGRWVVPFLVENLDSPRVGRLAREILCEYPRIPVAFAAKLIEWTGHEDPEIRTLAVRAMSLLVSALRESPVVPHIDERGGDARPDYAALAQAAFPALLPFLGGLAGGPGSLARSVRDRTAIKGFCRSPAPRHSKRKSECSCSSRYSHWRAGVHVHRRART